MVVLGLVFVAGDNCLAFRRGTGDDTCLSSSLTVLEV